MILIQFPQIIECHTERVTTHTTAILVFFLKTFTSLSYCICTYLFIPKTDWFHVIRPRRWVCLFKNAHNVIKIWYYVKSSLMAVLLNNTGNRQNPSRNHLDNRSSVCRQRFRNFLKNYWLNPGHTWHWHVYPYGWVSWLLFIFMFLASISALWWPNIWPEKGVSRFIF